MCACTAPGSTRSAAYCFGDGLINPARALQIRAAANMRHGPEVQHRDLAAQWIVQRRHSGLVLLVERELLLRLCVTTELPVRDRQRVVGRAVRGNSSQAFW